MDLYSLRTEQPWREFREQEQDPGATRDVWQQQEDGSHVAGRCVSVRSYGFGFSVKLWFNQQQRDFLLLSGVFHGAAVTDALFFKKKTLTGRLAAAASC